MTTLPPSPSEPTTSPKSDRLDAALTSLEIRSRIIMRSGVVSLIAITLIVLQGLKSFEVFSTKTKLLITFTDNAIFLLGVLLAAGIVVWLHAVFEELETMQPEKISHILANITEIDRRIHALPSTLHAAIGGSLEQPLTRLIDAISGCTGYVHFIPSADYPELAMELISRHRGFVIFANVTLLMFEEDAVFEEIWKCGIFPNRDRIKQIVLNVQEGVEEEKLAAAKDKIIQLGIDNDKWPDTLKVMLTRTANDGGGEVRFLILGEESKTHINISEIIAFAKHEALNANANANEKYEGGFFWLRINQLSPIKQASVEIKKIQDFSRKLLYPGPENSEYVNIHEVT